MKRLIYVNINGVTFYRNGKTHTYHPRLHLIHLLGKVAKVVSWANVHDFVYAPKDSK